MSDLPLTFDPPNFAEVDPDRVALGQLLFYDPILSGSQTVACATCHHPRFATSDGVSLGLGDGGVGLGPDRVIDPDNLPEQRIPRNSPALFNLGAEEFSVMFHDGRLEADATRPNGIRTPLGDAMAEGFASVLSAQAMFPVLSPDEMAGHYSENPIGQSVRLGQLSLPGGAWDQIAARVAAVPGYRTRFDAVLGADAEITFTAISDMVAEFIIAEWRADDSPFDRYLEGGTLSDEAMRGMDLFYGDAGCAACHAGRFQTDHDFHAIAMPQLGPGKAARFEDHALDEGRMHVTGDPADAYAFRTPSLRNVARTAPYGHSGAYATLEGVIRHHLDPVAALHAYDRTQVLLPDLPGARDWRVMDDPEVLAAIAAANELQPSDLTDAQIADLIAFLNALTDETSLSGRLGIPDAVPSGLTVPR
ncbi:c-type cytochrome [Rhodobacterales bacterium HKCCE4037]|nr:c-type cytochrome [Rhodobacterales bacterium HKCCE4037]